MSERSRDRTAIEHVEKLISEGRAAEAMLAADGSEVESPSTWARIWLLVGSPRALRPLRDLLEGPLREEVDAVLKRGLPELPLPRGSYERVAEAARDLSASGRVHQLVLHHLAMADVAPRVDWRVNHIEHASSLAERLDDPGLRALVLAFEGRLAFSLGEDEDAKELAEAALAEGQVAGESRAVALAERVLALVSGAPLRGLDGLALVGDWGLEPRSQSRDTEPSEADGGV